MSSCPLCQSVSSSPFPIYYSFQNKIFHARQCGSCSFIYLDPRLTAEELAVLYSDEYFLFDGAECGAHSSTDYETAARAGSVKFPEIIAAIKRFKSSGDFFEVGCGMGYFLDFARSSGFRVSGIEYADLGVQRCREKFGLDVERSSIEAYPLHPEAFDVIFLGDVLEHLVDPLGALRKSHGMLRPGGIVAIEVPSQFNSLVGRLATFGLSLLAKSKHMPMPPYHVNEFTPVTLRRILKEAEFQGQSIVQRIKAPKGITLRGNWIEKLIKLSLQYPNYAITKSLGIFGDRLLGIGVKSA